MKYGLSVVVPVFNSEDTLEELVERLNKTLCKICDFEIILIDDGSVDKSWEYIKKMKTTYSNINAISFDRNYGQHIANLCGFREAKFEYILTIDDDLQNPPEESILMLEKAKEGYDLVIGKFRQKNHNLTRKLGSLLITYLNKRIFRVKNNLKLSNYRLIHKSVLDKFIDLNHTFPYIPGLILTNSVNPTNILVNHYARRHGRSKYNFRKLVKLTFALLFQHSTIPLRLSSLFGFAMSGLTFIGGGVIVLNHFLRGTVVPGWTSIAFSLAFFNGILILLISVIGEYILNILRNVSPLKTYIVKDRI